MDTAVAAELAVTRGSGWQSDGGQGRQETDPQVVLVQHFM